MRATKAGVKDARCLSELGARMGPGNLAGLPSCPGTSHWARTSLGNLDFGRRSLLDKQESTGVPGISVSWTNHALQPPNTH